MLIARGLVTAEQVEDGLLAQRSLGGRLGTNLIEAGHITDDDLARCLSDQLGFPYVRSPALAAIPREVIARLPRNLAEKYRIFPLRFQGGELHVCMADPQNFAKLDELGFALNCRPRPCVVTEVSMDYALERYYGIRREVRMKDASGGMRDLHTPTPSPGYYERVTEAPPIADPSSQPSAAVVEELARVMTDDDVTSAVFHYFTDIFAEAMILAVATRLPVLVRAGSKTRGRVVRAGMSVPITEGGLMHGILAKAQAVHKPTIVDPDLSRICSALAFPLDNHSFVPISDGTRPFYLVIGQGREEHSLVSAFPGIKSFVAKASQALRIVALRREISAA